MGLVRYQGTGALYDISNETGTTSSATVRVLVIPFYGTTTIESDISVPLDGIHTQIQEFVRDVKKKKRIPYPVHKMRHGKRLAAPASYKARHGFQQMCRIPCYRGTRTR